MQNVFRASKIKITLKNAVELQCGAQKLAFPVLGRGTNLKNGGTNLTSPLGIVLNLLRYTRQYLSTLLQAACMPSATNSARPVGRILTILPFTRRNYRDVPLLT
jgi:hypothetical protein